MKTKISKARVSVKARFKSEGSVLAETVQARGVGFETKLELESEEPPERVAAVVRNAENGCYVLQSILHPVPVEHGLQEESGLRPNWSLSPRSPRSGLPQWYEMPKMGATSCSPSSTQCQWSARSH